MTDEWRGSAPGYDLRITPHGVDARYLAYVLLSTPARDYFNDLRSRAAQPHLNADQVANLRVPVVGRVNQRWIADFLDAETARIDALIDSRGRQRTLVIERLTCEIDRAFSVAPGQTPVRLKHILRSAPCYGVLVPQFQADGVPFVRVGDLVGLEQKGTALSRIEPAQSIEYSRTIVEAGDVLVSVVGSVDKCAVVPPRLANANVARAVARLRPIRGLPSDLLTAWISTPSYLTQAALATGSDTAQPTLNMGDLANFVLHLPHTKGGLNDLALALRFSRAKTRDAVTAIDRQIVLLRERRQALITEAVTGTLQVPGVPTPNAST